MRAIAIIPARGGSKRIPRKNVIDFAGKPLLAWTIDAALGSGLFDYVLVSTDDADIATCARAYGGQVPFLRDSAADDTAPVAAATLAALRQAEIHWGQNYDTVVQLMPNCPLRDSTDIAVAFDRFRATRAPFLLSCFRYGWMNPWWAHRLDASGRPEALFKEALTKRSQELDDLYCPSGAIWIANVAALRESGTFYGAGHIFHPIDWRSAVDIDDVDDLDLALSIRHMRERAG
ncbi:MAG: acylneuraminate cytidylyltransferase family protein [Pseudorhodoplanes sp.]|nr:acylneuraminate cytidylyltransferase family protein [Pseudorhodoplanes sp.]